MEDVGKDKSRLNKLRKLPSLLLAWYDRNKRDLPWRENTDPYRVLVSEVMLQQTRVEAVREKYERFIRELPTAEALAACSEERLMKLWEGLGYYSRARNLQRAAVGIVERGFPETAEELKKLPGVGEYTAGAVASIAFGAPEPAVDGNVVRVLSRLQGDAELGESLRKRYSSELRQTYPATRCGDYTQSLMELGAVVCLPRSPGCGECPLAGLCETKSDRLPVRKGKPERKKAELTMLLFRDGEEVALCRRKEGVLSGMYGLLTEKGKFSERQVSDFLTEKGISGTVADRKEHRHVFSHLEWEITAYLVICSGSRAVLWAEFPELEFFPVRTVREEISLASAYRWCLGWIDETGNFL